MCTHTHLSHPFLVAAGLVALLFGGTACPDASEQDTARPDMTAVIDMPESMSDASMMRDLSSSQDMPSPPPDMPEVDAGVDLGEQQVLSARDKMLNTPPEVCGECHVEHYADWAGSMHAYATQDPIFEGMLKKGIEETEGKLDQFCIQCHAPVASKLGDTPVTQLADDTHVMPLDRQKTTVHQGVVCTTCHATTSVESTVNADFSLTDSVTLYGPTGNAAAVTAHAEAGLGEVKQSSLLTRSLMCGSCHNVVNPKGALLENTFSEWYAGPFNTGNPDTDRSCQDCHMPQVQGEIVSGKVAAMHRHTFVGVDIALIDDFPDKVRQRRLVEELLQSAAELTITRVGRQGADIRVDVKNINNGHALPSGSTADRQVWVHLQVYDQDDNLIFESGMMDANGDLMDRVDGHSLTPGGDPDLLMFGSLLFNEHGEHVTFPWQASRSQDFLLQPGQTGWREFRLEPELLEGVSSVRAEATLRYRTFPPFLIRELKQEGHLEQDAVPSTVPIIDMASKTITFTLP